MSNIHVQICIFNFKELINCIKIDKIDNKKYNFMFVYISYKWKFAYVGRMLNDEKVGTNKKINAI